MKTITAEEFDRMFDDGEDISEYVDWSKGFHPNQEPHPLDVDVPLWIVNKLDHHAGVLGVTRQELIRRWLEERLKDISEEVRDVAE